MRFQLDIDYPLEKMEQSRQRHQARARFESADRVPVAFCLVPRFFAPIFGIPYCELFKDVETHFYWQLQFYKYRLENIPIERSGPVAEVAETSDGPADSGLKSGDFSYEGEGVAEVAETSDGPADPGLKSGDFSYKGKGEGGSRSRGDCGRPSRSRSEVWRLQLRHPVFGPEAWRLQLP